MSTEYTNGRIADEVGQLTFTECKMVYTAAVALERLQDQLRGTTIADELGVTSARDIMQRIDRRSFSFGELIQDRRETEFRRKTRNGWEPPSKQAVRASEY